MAWKTISTISVVVAVALAIPATVAVGRGGGGGGRGGGGGGARPAPRPSMGHSSPRPPQMSRPPQASRPPQSRPPQASRPSFSQAGNRPASRPQPSTRPQPSPRPSMGIQNGAAKPVTRPVSGQRPNNSRPGTSNRPSFGNANRPNAGERPNIGGGNRPGERPNIGGGNRPGERPVIGGGGNRPANRPVIGGHNVVNRPGGNVNIGNINNINNINNRPGWGGGGVQWADHWRGNYINYHHDGWYHGCWGGHWGAGWYAPMVWGATAWGLSAVLPTWGYNYGYAYANPYYVAQPAATVAYDYSQPITVNNYAPPAEGEAPQEPPQVAAAYSDFDQATAAFKQGDYATAYESTQKAIRAAPKDPVLHEFNALCLFALGSYDRAAAVLNSFLAAAPGMDWTTLSGLYPDTNTYAEQLRALENHCQAKPDDIGAHFVLAYHYMVGGHPDAAARRLKYVVSKQPKDEVAKRMLAALEPPADATAAVPKPAETPEPAADAPTTDLVGQWQAKRDGDVFELTIDESGGFTWKAVPAGKPPAAISGTFVTTADTLVMESKDQGTMVGRVKSGGADQFQFITTGGPPNDPGLSFQRVKS